MTVTETMRRLARRPRSWAHAVRANESTIAAERVVRRARGRATLTLRAARGWRRRSAAWTALVADVSTLAPPPAAPGVTVVRIAAGDTATVVARAAAASTDPLLCFLLDSTEPLDPGWLARLAAACSGSGVVAVAPTTVHPVRGAFGATPYDARVRAQGIELAVVDDAPALRARKAGSIVQLNGDPLPVPGASAACLVVERSAYERAGGLPQLHDIELVDDLDLAGFELGRRLRAQGGQIVVARDTIMIDHRAVASPLALTEPVARDGAAWSAYVEAHGAALMQEAAPLPADALRFAITVAAPSVKVAPRWGDWHLAGALARALGRRGHHVRVQTFDHADDLAGRACDVHVVVRGLERVRRTPGQAHVLWIISHPESIDPRECDEADLVLVASERFAAALRGRTATPVEVMLQATDAHRFHPVDPEPRHTHDVAIVAKSRDVFRAAVADALAAGLRPAIYGNGWDGLVDPALVVADYVPNEELPAVYSSVRVLLNDHWETMRASGFVSNRLFDALACGTPVISDELPEIPELFDGAVLTYRDPAELRARVETALADRDGARARAARGRDLVLAHHTFEHRADQLVEALRRNGLIRRSSSGRPEA